MGPLNDENAFDKSFQILILDSKKEDLQLVVNVINQKDTLLNPTIFIDVRCEFKIHARRNLWTILAVCKVKSFEEALW
jgi:acyl-CoA reductase-like NAD-dependent aldehyde dehydrogenase